MSKARLEPKPFESGSQHEQEWITAIFDIMGQKSKSYSHTTSSKPYARFSKLPFSSEFSTFDQQHTSIKAIKVIGAMLEQEENQLEDKVNAQHYWEMDKG